MGNNITDEQDPPKICQNLGEVPKADADSKTVRRGMMCWKGKAKNVFVVDLKNKLQPGQCGPVAPMNQDITV